MIDKNTQVEALTKRLKDIASSSIKSQKYNKSFAAISFAADTLYMFNQKYVDDELELLTAELADVLKTKYNFAAYLRGESTDTILLYDGFGLDTRGVVLMYLNALGVDGYHVCYVTNKHVENQIPSIKNMCNKYDFTMRYVDMSDYTNCFMQLAAVFDSEKPRSAFFYTTPHDSAASAAFHMYDGLCNRYLIDLTDHAFWLGKCANDYFLGSREMSAYIQHFQRGIPKEKCIKLGVNLLVEEITDHQGLPFDVTKEKYIFSGGALYKTLGDPSNTYYRIIRHILEKYSDLKFIYAGTGDDSELKKILNDFPDRAFHIDERKDFYYLIEHSVFYLNTYPMFGGMMMKYSALARRLPITLKHGSDSDGLLLHQDECRIEYNTFEELIEDVDHLLEDENYRNEREQLLNGSVITEERFARNLRGVIEANQTDYSHEFVELDTKKFRQEYYERFEFEQHMLRIANKRNIDLFRYFPKYYVIKVIEKIVSKLEKGKTS